MSSNLDLEEKQHEIEDELLALRKQIHVSLSPVSSEILLEQILNEIIDQIGRNEIRLIFPQYKKDEYLRDIVKNLITFFGRSSCLATIGKRQSDKLKVKIQFRS